MFEEEKNGLILDKKSVFFFLGKGQIQHNAEALVGLKHVLDCFSELGSYFWCIIWRAFFKGKYNEKYRLKWFVPKTVCISKIQLISQ